MATEGEGSILRGNNLINKIEGVYLRIHLYVQINTLQCLDYSLDMIGNIGAQYLRVVLSDLVTKLVADKDLNLEVDPR